MRILYADSIPSRALTNDLLAQCDQVDLADNLYDVRCFAATNTYGCIVLGGADARSFLDALRKDGCPAPILLLTTCDQASERIAALDAGADACLSFPFSSGELLAHVRALLRRQSALHTEQLTAGSLTLDQPRAILRCGEREQSLSRKEYLLMETLMARPGMVFSAASLIETIWGSESDAEPDTLWVYISALRRKIKKLDADVCIQNRRGIGYAIVKKAGKIYR